MKLGPEENSSTTSSFPTVVIQNLLDAMKVGSREAFHIFPKALQLVEAHPKTMSIFIEKVKTVPCWMFLPWASHLVALLDKPHAAAVQPLVLTIADEYPNVSCLKCSLHHQD